MIGSITSIQHDGGSIRATVEGESERRVVAVDQALYMQIVQIRGGAEHVTGQFVEVVEQGTEPSIRLLSRWTCGRSPSGWRRPTPTARGTLGSSVA